MRRTFRITALECSSKEHTRGRLQAVPMVCFHQSEDRLSSSTDVIMKSEEDIMLNISSTLRQPSAFLPIAMSLAALALVLGHIALFGITHEADEGAAAHIWQL